MLDLIEFPLREQDFTFTRYDGRLDRKERERRLIRLKTDSETTVLLMSLKCGALGLNLTCCHHVVMVDPWWNPAVEHQAIDRVHRIGQQKKVTVHRLVVADTVEDRILELQRSKQDLADAALDGSKIRSSRLSVKDLCKLFNVSPPR